MTEWDKFQKMVSLKSEKIELGLVDDARDYAKSVFSKRDEIVSILGKLKKPAQEGIKDAEQAIRLTNQAIQQAKDLGIKDYPKEWDNIIKQMTERIKDFKDYA